tara:strand:+ start:57189 stop:57647 length:459 start_codon:yes stop_codon:yes gene_type:complete
MYVDEVMHEATHIEDGVVDVPIRLYDLETPLDHPLFNMKGRVVDEIMTEFTSFFDRHDLSHYPNRPFGETSVYLKLGTSRVQVPCYILSHSVEINEIEVTTIGSLEREFVSTPPHGLDFTVSIYGHDIDSARFPKKERREVIYLTKFDILDI